MMKKDVSLTMGPMQALINQSHGPKVTDAYGSLFEFLDADDAEIVHDRTLKKKLSEIKHQVDQKILQENNEILNTSARRRQTPPIRHNRVKLKSLVRNMNQSFDQRDRSPQQSTLKNNSFSEAYQEIRNEKSTASILLGNNRSKKCLRQKSVFLQSSQNDSFVQEPSLVLHVKDESPKKTVAFRERARTKSGNLDYSYVPSRLNRYLNKKASVLKNSEKEIALWNMYQIETQNKKTSFLNSELDMLNKLAIKGGHHLLKIQKGALFKEEVNKDNPGQDSYNKSFIRIKEGLKVIREKKQSQLYFDEYGNYISYKKSKSNFGVNPNQTATSLHSSPSKLTDKSIDKSVDRKTTETNETLEDDQSKDGDGEDSRDKLLRKKSSYIQRISYREFGLPNGERAIVNAKPREETPKANKSLKDHKLYLLNKDKRRWLENHRISKNQQEVEKVTVNKEDLGSILYMQKIKDMSMRGQRGQLRKIEEELIDKQPFRRYTQLHTFTKPEMVIN